MRDRQCTEMVNIYFYLLSTDLLTGTKDPSSFGLPVVVFFIIGDDMSEAT